MATLTR